jgi:hypothetical protein
MPACADPSKRPSHDVVVRLIDTVAWAKTLMITTAGTIPLSDERKSALLTFRQAAVEARRDIDAVLNEGFQLPDQILIEMRVCEMAVPQLEAGAVLRTKALP